MSSYNRLTQARTIVVMWHEITTLPEDVELTLWKVLNTFPRAYVAYYDNIFFDPLRIPMPFSCGVKCIQVPESGNDRFSDLFDRLPCAEPYELFLLSSDEVDVRCANSSGWLTQHFSISGNPQLIPDLLERCKDAQAERQKARQLIAD